MLKNFGKLITESRNKEECFDNYDYMRIPFLTSFSLIALLGVFVSGCPGKPSSNLNSAVSNSKTPIGDESPDIHPSAGADQRVMFESGEKVQIVGSFFAASKPNSPAVLLLHQFGSNRQSYDDFAKRLQAKGFGVLAIDGRGFGESVKTADGKTIEISRSDEAVKGMRRDVAAAFEFLSKQQNVDAARIGIVGASYGSSLAIIYAAENPKVKAVALLSPGLNYFGNMPTEPSVKNFGSRALLMVAADDDAESADTVKKLEAVGASEKYETQIYAKGGHGTSLFKARVGLEDLLEQFLTKSL